MAPKNEAGHCIWFSSHYPIDAMFVIVFAAITGVEKLTNLLQYYIQSITQTDLGPGQSWVEPVLVKFY